MTKEYHRFNNTEGLDEIARKSLRERTRKKPPIDYAAKLENTQTGNISYDLFVRQIASTLRFMDKIDPYSANPLKPLEDKVNSFLQRHTGLDYRTFMSGAHPEKYNTNDFSKIQKKSLKKRLFDYRAKLYLAALADCESQGYDWRLVLNTVRGLTIPFLKKETDEPTFEQVAKTLTEAH